MGTVEYGETTMKMLLTLLAMLTLTGCPEQQTAEHSSRTPTLKEIGVVNMDQPDPSVPEDVRLTIELLNGTLRDR